MSLERRMNVCYGTEGDGGDDGIGAIANKVSRYTDVAGAVISGGGLGLDSKRRKKYNDGEIARISDNLKGAIEKYTNTQKDWAKTLGEGGLVSRTGGFFYGIGTHVPIKKIRRYFQRKREEVSSDPFDVMERKSKEALNGVEEHMIQIGEQAQVVTKSAEENRAKLEKAKKEGWGIPELRDYYYDLNDQRPEQKVIDILNFASEHMTQGQRDIERSSMIETLENQILVQEQLVATLMNTTLQAAAAYNLFQKQYSGILTVKDSMQIVGEAELNLAGSEQLGVDAGQYVRENIDKIADLATTAIQSLNLLEEQLIANPETIQKLKEANTRIETAVDNYHSGSQQVKISKVNKIKV